MPMLGIMASGMSGNLWAPSGAYDSISSVTLDATTANVTFSGIPATYTHLQIRAIVKTSTAGTSVENIYIRLNSDTAANYALHYLMGSGAAASASGATNDTQMVGFNFVPQVGNTPFGTIIIDTLDYANTNKYKTTRFLAGADLNGSGYISLGSGLWRNTAAVTSITLSPGAGSFVQYSSFALYGVK